MKKDLIIIMAITTIIMGGSMFYAFSNSWSDSYENFSGHKSKEKFFKEGQRLRIQASIDSGTLRIVVKQNDIVLLNRTISNEQDVSIKVPRQGLYKIELFGENANGELMISWS